MDINRSIVFLPTGSVHPFSTPVTNLLQGCNSLKYIACPSCSRKRNKGWPVDLLTSTSMVMSVVVSCQCRVYAHSSATFLRIWPNLAALRTRRRGRPVRHALTRSGLYPALLRVRSHQRAARWGTVLCQKQHLSLSATSHRWLTAVDASCFTPFS